MHDTLVMSNNNDSGAPRCRKFFYINATRIAVLEALSGLPPASISDIARRANKRPGTIGNVLSRFLELGLVQNVEGTGLYCINPKFRKPICTLCSNFHLLFGRKTGYRA